MSGEKLKYKKIKSLKKKKNIIQKKLNKFERRRKKNIQVRGKFYV